MQINELRMRAPDDMHVHLRDNDNDDMLLSLSVAMTARMFRRAIVMPNLRPPVRTAADAVAYRNRILAALEGAREDNGFLATFGDFQPLMTLYLTDATTPQDIIDAKDSGVVYGVKYYPPHGTTNSQDGATDLRALGPVFEEMERCGIPLLLHGEVVHDPDTGAEVDIFEREKRFLGTVARIMDDHEHLKIVLEHVSTAEAARFVESYWEMGDRHIAATITPQHLLENRNALFRGGLQPHAYCMPILKTEEDRRALVHAATSGKACFFAGTDSAPHMRRNKEKSCGCAGCFTAPFAIELYATAFDRVGRLEALEDFTSKFGAEFYGLPLSESTITLHRTQTMKIPGDVGGVVPFWAGQSIEWMMEEP